MYEFDFITLKQTISSEEIATEAILYETDIYIIGGLGSVNIDVVVAPLGIPGGRSPISFLKIPEMA